MVVPCWVNSWSPLGPLGMAWLWSALYDGVAETFCDCACLGGATGDDGIIIIAGWYFGGGVLLGPAMWEWW